MKPLRYLLISTALCVTTASCGVVYHGQSVREGIVDGTKVRVVDLNPETVLAANREPVQTRSLPAAFSQTAGTYGSSGGGVPSDLPGPANRQQNRPAEIATRLPPAPPEGPYRIGVGDVVLLATKAPASTAAELSGLLAAENRRQGYTVQDDGAIAIPDVGRVRIADMTIEDAEAKIFQQLLAQQIDPSFSLEVSEFNARHVAIGGAVVRPGVVPVTLTPLALDTVIASVGGTTAVDRSGAAIRIYRQGTLYQLPLEEFYKTPSWQKIRLVDGDSVFIDTEYDLVQAQAYFEQQITLSQARQAGRNSALSALSQEVALRRSDLEEARTNFQTRLELGAEKRDYVYITGEVRNQGRLPLPYDQTASLADALYEQGGIAAGTGNPRQIYVLRGSADPREFGSLTAWHLDGGRATNMMLATRLELRPNDVVFVSEQPVTRWSRVINQITPSLITVPLNNVTKE